MASNGLTRCLESHQDRVRRLVDGAFCLLLPPSCHHRLGSEQIADADQVVGHDMQPEHRSHL